jgi:hypothetical protein
MDVRLHRELAPAAAAVLLLLAVLLLTAAPALAAPAKVEGNIVAYNKNTVIPLGTSAHSVVAFGGSVTVAGSVRTAVAAFGADVRLLPTARLGTTLGPNDSSLLVIGGTTTTAAGAQVAGKSTTWTLGSLRSAVASGFWRPIVRPFAVTSLVVWAGSTVVVLALGLLIAGLFPRQTRRVSDRISTRYWSSLGWGALSAFIIVPLVTAALIVTIVGIILAVPWLLIVVPAVLLFGYVSFAALLGGWLLGLAGYRGGSMILAALTGVMALQLVRLIPIAGEIAAVVATVVGFGAAITAFVEWRVERSRLRAAPVPQEAAPAQESTLRAA